MHSPFPGMDPFLENPALWKGFHNSFIAYLVASLNEVLPEDYVAASEQRLYVSHRMGQIIPDVLTMKEPESGRSPSLTGGQAVLSRADPPAIVIAIPEEVSEFYIEIRHSTEIKRVVTVIEFLSYGNKAAGSEGRKMYVQKQSDVMKSDVHLLEIDLLRKGEYTLAAPYERIVAEYGYWDYLISLSRSTARLRFELHLRTVRQKLPCIRVPLDNGDPDVDVDIQEVFNRCYSEGAYSRLIDYNRDPYHPLSPADAAWSESLLVEKGLRGSRPNTS